MSHSLLGFSERASCVRGIVDWSLAWNVSVGITGALVSTERHFVQFVEGPDASIDELVARLKADGRHTSMNILEETGADHRHFARWSLAYTGPDTFIDNELAALVQTGSACEKQATVRNLRSRLLAMAHHADQ